MMDEVQFLNKILYNPFLREKFQNFEENTKYFSYYNKEDYVEKLEKLILEKLEKMTAETFDIELITSWFQCILEESYFNDVYLLFHSHFNQVLIQKARELNVDITFYTDYISKCLEQLEYSSKYEESINRYLNYRNDKYMMNSEFERYVFALNMIDDVNEDNFGYVFNMILDKKYQLSNAEYQSFFKRFGLFAMKQFGFKHSKLTFKQNLEGAGKHRTEMTSNGERIHHIFIKKGTLSVKNLLGNIQVLFHEIKHGVQIEETHELYRLDNIKQLEDIVLKKYLGEHFYEINHDMISSESDAEICSYILLSQFLKSFAPLTYRKEKEQLDLEIENQAIISQNDIRKLTYKDEYHLQTLFATVIKQNPEILNGNVLSKEEQQVLLQVYNRDATPKTPDVYFKEKEKLLLELQMLPLSEQEKILSIKKKIDFYDSILGTFEYNIENLKRNFIALDNYQSNNPDIMAEVFQYKHAIIDKLISYGYGTTITFSEKRVTR